MTDSGDEASLAILPAPPRKTKRPRTFNRILFVGADAGSVAAFRDEITSLAARQYPIEIAIEEGDAADLEALRSSLPSLQIGLAPSPRERRWGPITRLLKWWLDYGTLLEGRAPPDPAVTARLEAAAPRLVVGLARAFHGKRFASLLSALERQIPPDPAVCSFIERHRPSVLMIAPLLEIGSLQADYIRAASAAGVRSLFLVSRWDQLTTGGVAHAVPDWVAVWNRAQRREAIERLGVMPQYTAVLGAPGPMLVSATQKQLEGQLPLDISRPLFVYLAPDASSATPVQAIRKWVREVRGHSDPAVNGAALAISVGQGQDSVAAALAAWGRSTGRSNFTVVMRNSEVGGALLRNADSAVAADRTGVFDAVRAGQPVLLAPETDVEATITDLRVLHESAPDGMTWLGRAEAWPQHLESLRAAATNDDAQAVRRAAARAFTRPHGLELSPGTALCNHIIDEIVAAPPAHPPVSVKARAWLGPLNFLASLVERGSANRAET